MRIERLSTAEEFHACEKLQQSVWRSGPVEVIPLHVLVTFQRSGGLVLGAFDERDAMIGCLIGFLGWQGEADHRPKHCSHLMGVREDWRGQGVGHRLKLVQREHALAQGLDLVTWTFDPLESLNAALNITKLGGVSRTYIRDLYGATTDGLNAGLSTDRFQVDWWIGSKRVRDRLSGERPKRSIEELKASGASMLNPVALGSDGLPRPSTAPKPPDATTALVEIPAQIRTIKAADLALARAWREQTRELFEAGFRSGYVVTGFVSEAVDGVRRSAYVLEKDFEVI